MTTHPGRLHENKEDRSAAAASNKLIVGLQRLSIYAAGRGRTANLKRNQHPAVVHLTDYTMYWGLTCNLACWGLLALLLQRVHGGTREQYSRRPSSTYHTSSRHLEKVKTECKKQLHNETRLSAFNNPCSNCCARCHQSLKCLRGITTASKRNQTPGRAKKDGEKTATPHRKARQQIPPPLSLAASQKRKKYLTESSSLFACSILSVFFQRGRSYKPAESCEKISATAPPCQTENRPPAKK